MEYIIITNNRKVANLYRETNQVKFYEFKDFLHILDKVQEQVYEGRKLLSDPIISHLEDAKILLNLSLFRKNISKKIKNLKGLSTWL